MSRVRTRNRDELNSTDLNSKRFSPKDYINATMKNKDYGQILEEIEAIKREQGKGIEEMRLMVTQHLKTFIACKTTVENLHETDSGLLHKDTLSDFRSKQKAVEEKCSSVFGDLLQKDSTLVELKQASQVLDKFQFLLSIPETIKKNIQAEEYQKVIYDYKKAQRYEADHKYDKHRQGAKLFRGVFSEINEAVSELRTELLGKLKTIKIGSKGQSETHAQRDLLNFLRELDTPHLLREYVSIVKARLFAVFGQSLRNLESIIQTYQQSAMRAKEQEAAWQQMLSVKSSAQLRARMSSQLGLRPKESEFGFTSNRRVPSTRDLLSEIDKVSESCALPETLAYIAECGQNLADHLVSFWSVYQHQWEEQKMEQRGEAPQGTEKEVGKLFIDSAYELEKYVWPCITHLQPDSHSGASLQEWRSALLSLVKPINYILSTTTPPSHGRLVLAELRDKCQMQFVQQACGQLTSEIASWAQGIEWKVGFNVSRGLQSTELPLKFEKAILDLQTLMDSSDELRSETQQIEDLRERIFQAHKDFVDLLHYLAFGLPENDEVKRHDTKSVLSWYASGGDKRGSTAVPTEDRLLMVWADCHVFENIVSINTFSAFAKTLGDELTEEASTKKFDLCAASWSASELGSSRNEQRKSDLNVLHSFVKTVKEKIVMHVVTRRMHNISNIIALEGFMRPDINWAYAAEPTRVRNYCHMLLLELVKLHEATIRLTMGNATRDIMVRAFNQTMGAFLYSVKQLDFFSLSDTACANATLQLEIELEFLTTAMSGFRSQTWQSYQSRVMEWLMQFYVNTNKEADRRKKTRNRVFVDFQRVKVMIDALKQDPVDMTKSMVSLSGSTMEIG
eukprot:TRINITY_DN13696_c0_g2_i1.p1 TRINITY_DN13696_c0_g2~~TRINITY_DN13696_c0_g2_i1.p1  ORF type:complete len:849 (+),score=316.44 TRINITY_DN13696_c0_g2_i1:40-2586(+)